MAITSYSQTRVGGITTVTVVSDLGGTIYYHWYIDGAYIGRTDQPTKVFYLEVADQVRIEVADTNDVAFDPVLNAPEGFPRRRTLFWCRSTDVTAVKYRIEQQREAEGWVTLAYQPQNERQWSFTYLTPRLDDLTNYTWRITPVDEHGNDGTAITIGPEYVVGTPDAPNFTVSFDDGTQIATIAEAA